MKRSIYKKLLEWKSYEERRPLILRGARQTGKTHILKEFGQSEFRKIHYVNFLNNIQIKEIFELSLSINDLLIQLNYFFKTEIDLNADMLFLDEIQESPRALSLLKAFNEEFPSFAICCAGSHMGLIFTKESFPVGKVDFLNLYPMTFEEFLLSGHNEILYEKYKQVKNQCHIENLYHDDLLIEFKLYLLTGGLPNVIKIFRSLYKGQVTSKIFDRIRREQNILLDSYISDFAKHSGKINASHINSIFQNVARNISKVKEGGLGKFIFKNVIPGKAGHREIQGPLNWLIATNLVIPVYIINKAESPFLAYSKDNKFKLYFFDIGLLGAMMELDFQEILNFKFGIAKGAYTENFVAQELFSAGERKLYSWQENTSELEFIIKKNSQIIPIEVKSGSYFRARSFEYYCKRYSPKMAYIISMNPADFSNKKVYKLPLYCPQILLPDGKLPRTATTV